MGLRKIKCWEVQSNAYTETSTLHMCSGLTHISYNQGDLS